MIRTISPQDMREMERAFLEGTGYPSILLMEHAAQAVVDALSAYAKAGSRVLFVCGSGNNGGDGFVCARILLQKGRDVAVVCVAEKFTECSPPTPVLSPSTLNHTPSSFPIHHPRFVEIVMAVSPPSF